MLIVAIMAAFCAYAIIDTLIREFGEDVTYVDLGAIFILGLFSGAALGLSRSWGRKQE